MRSDQALRQPLMPTITLRSEVGFYGKLPSNGDFLRRRVSDAFVGVWDGWLQECIAASRAALGDRWLDVYLTSPVWRFCCASGVCGSAPLIGLMAPSVDRVGRYFPLTLVAELPSDATLVSAARDAEPFFENAERLVIETLAADAIDVDGFESAVTVLARDLVAIGSPPPVVLERAAGAILTEDGRADWQVPIAASAALASAFDQVLSQRLSQLYDPLVLWWSNGSSTITPSCLITKGLPHPDTFAALLDGAWSRRQWRSVAAHVDISHDSGPVDVEGAKPPRFRSAAATDVGRVRNVNQDAFVERTEVGLWAVADGLGGHVDGEVASRMVCDALVDFVPDSSFEDAIDGARNRITEVNDYLFRSSGSGKDAGRCGSTVVAFLARGTRCAVVWAGDSRVYRWRGGRFEQLTRDHSAAEPGDAGTHGQTNVITRAVGGEATLMLDVYRGRVHAGDRFLLCSDGLTRVLPEGSIRTWMQHEDIQFAVEGLIAATLDGGAPDNVTAVIVEAFS